MIRVRQPGADTQGATRKSEDVVVKAIKKCPKRIPLS